jgi:transcriptional regulator with XRE-family HTH domain
MIISTINKTTLIMSNLNKITFKNTEQKSDLMQNYSFILNELVKVKRESKVTSRFLAKGLGVSIGTISHFENEKTIDFKMLNNYAGIFKYKISIFLDKMTYSEIMSN